MSKEEENNIILREELATICKQLSEQMHQLDNNTTDHTILASSNSYS